MRFCMPFFLNSNPMKVLQRLLLALLMITGNLVVSGQVVTSDPAIPVASKPVTIYFDATQGTGGLKDYSGDVYAHTGVLTTSSTNTKDWKYVKTDWGVNTPETKLTRVATNLYSLEISPSIRGYYDVPENETITHLAFVFRSADNSKEGKDDGGVDILLEVFEPGLNITIIQPAGNELVNPGTSLNFEAAASEEASLELLLNGESVKTASGTTISHTFDFNTQGDYWIKVTAATGEEYAADSVFVHTMGTQPMANLPVGMRMGINYPDDHSATLVLQAPGKEHVFVIGDFNQWIPNASSRMNKDDDYWWITLENLEAGKEYAFQYLVDGKLRIADPYTEKVLDPDNDRWIPEQTYPNLIAYPYDYTTGNASVLQTAQVPYQWKNDNYSAPSNENLVIYELLVRDFLAAHDWKTLTDTLDYLENLGINAIEVMPFNEFEGNESWGYNPSFYFAPDKYYGPKDDLKAFVDSCHGRGIAVIMDMVLNHSFRQSPLVLLYYDEARDQVTPDNPWYNIESPNQAYYWGYDFNHESEYTKAFVDSVNSFWMTHYGIDGFRFDFTKGFTNTPGDGWAYDAARIAILKRMADEIWKVNPEAYVILEHLSDNSEEKVLADYGMLLWGNMNYNYNEATMGWHESNKSNFSGISYKNRGWNDPHLVGYMESHDEERLMFKNLEYGNAQGSYNIQELNTALARMELSGAFFFTIPGPKMIWQFGELGYDYSIDFNGRVGNKPIRWDYYEIGKRRRIYQVWSALINLKTSEPAFSTTDFVLNLANSTKRVELNHPDMDVRIIGNFDVVEKTVDPNFSKTGTWYDFFGMDSLSISDPNALISLAPGEYRLYTTKRLSDPEISASVKNPTATSKEVIIYPNPAEDFIFLSGNKAFEDITIYNMQGSMVKQFGMPAIDAALNINDLASGIYLLKGSSRNGLMGYARFVKN